MVSAFILGLGAGLAASPHCLGMCGGFPLHLARLARQSQRSEAVLRQVLFVTGKAFTYIFLGTIAASLGVVLLKDTSLASAAPVLRVAAGIITLIFGLLMLGFKLPSIRALQGISDAKIIRSMFGGLLHSSSPAAALVLGMGVGFLPCPLPLGMLAVAAASHNVLHGIALMAGVGVGTSAGLLAVGLFGLGINRRFAKIGMRTVGVFVVAVGLITIGRTTGIIHKSTTPSHVAPCCCGGDGE